jgi:hypothetical protein
VAGGGGRGSASAQDVREEVVDMAADLSGGGGWKVACDANFFGGFGFGKESGEVGGGEHGQLYLAREARWWQGSVP